MNVYIFCLHEINALTCTKSIDFLKGKKYDVKKTALDFSFSDLFISVRSLNCGRMCKVQSL